MFKVKISALFLLPIVHLVLADGAWSCVSKGSSKIWLIFVLVGVAVGMSPLIYGSHH
jgi:uncharacterized membrane protein